MVLHIFFWGGPKFYLDSSPCQGGSGTTTTTPSRSRSPQKKHTQERILGIYDGPPLTKEQVSALVQNGLIDIRSWKLWRCWSVEDVDALMFCSFFLRIFFDVLEKSGDTIHICRIGFKRHLFVSSFFFFCSMCFLFIGLTPNRLTQREHSKVENVFFVVAPLHSFILDNIVSYFDFLLFYPFSENFSTKQPRKTYHHLGKTAAERRVWGDLRLMKRRHEAFVPSVATTWGPEPKGRTGSTATRAPSRERRTAKRRCTK